MRLEIINILFTGLSSNDSAIQSLSNCDKTDFVHFPTIEIRESKLSREEKEKIKIAESYDYLIFTSVNAVKYFLLHYTNDYSMLSNKTKIVAIGDKTASKLLNNNMDIDLIPCNSSTDSINDLLTEKLINKKSILIPGSAISKVDLLNSLELKGAMVDFIAVYENNIPESISILEKKNILNTNFDLFVFTSPSTFYNFVSLLNITDLHCFFTKKVIAVIGPSTKEAIEKENLIVNIMPSKYNLNSLTTEIKNYYKLN